MEEGEDLWIIETDQGDGWTRVRRTAISSLDPMPEGFVPSSYIETCELFSSPRPAWTQGNPRQYIAFSVDEKENARNNITITA